MRVEDLNEMAEAELVQLRERTEEAIEMVRYMTSARGRERSREDRAEEAAQLVPEHLRGGLRRYLTEHLQPGHFLMAVLTNDLKEAMGRADVKSRAGLFDLVSYLYNWADATAWGDEENVRRWLTPAIPRMEFASLGEEVEMINEAPGAIYLPCPVKGCTTGKHWGHQTRVEPGVIHVRASDGLTKTGHDVLYVWHTPRDLAVVAVDGRRPVL